MVPGRDCAVSWADDLPEAPRLATGITAQPSTDDGFAPFKVTMYSLNILLKEGIIRDYKRVSTRIVREREGEGGGGEGGEGSEGEL